MSKWTVRVEFETDTPQKATVSVMNHSEQLGSECKCPVDTQNIVICKQALVELARIDPDGMTKDALLDVMQMGIGRRLLTREKDDAIFLLRDREWITMHTNPITGAEYWSITANRHHALSAL